MKHLFLIRHAKSSWADDSLSDRARPLNARGQSQLTPLGHALANSGGFSGRVYTSDAERAQATLKGILPATFPDERVQVCSQLYTFDFRRLVHWLQACENAETVAIVGHNPALLELAQWLLKHPPAQLPTASFMHIRIPTDHWPQITKGKGKLDTLLTPSQFSYAHFARKLKKQADTEGERPDKDIPAALLHQSERLHQLEPGVQVGLDDEFLHQYRIAIRRSRAIAESVQEVTDNKLLAKAIKQLKQYAARTSRLRDLHVFLQQLPALCPDNDELRTSLQSYFSRVADDEQEQLAKQLTGQRYRRKMNDWHDLIESRKFRKLAGSMTSKDIRKAVERRIKQVNARTAELTTESPDDDIHQLRKLLKRTRYLMELNRTGWKQPLKVLKSRQDNYGRFQDLHVQMELLDQFRSDAPDILPAAIGGLETRLQERKVEARRQILALGGLDDAPV